MSFETFSLIGFVVFIVAMLSIDLLLVGRKAHIVETREALIWSAIWITLGISFYFVIRYFGHLIHGIETPERLAEIARQYNPHLEFKTSTFGEMLEEYRKSQAINYLSGYFIEETLSIDNIFVMLMILHGFKVPHRDYKTVLFWGILGAIVLRFTFIFAGVAIIKRFEWILLLFGAFLLYQGIKMLVAKEKEGQDPKDSFIVKYLGKHLRLYPHYRDDKFWFRENRKLLFTPLFMVLVMIEFSDLVFAFDSIPAIFSVSLDPYIVFFSNVFAILGLRSLFFLIANLVSKFRFLKAGVSILLMFVGVKLLLAERLEGWGFKPEYSLIFIAGVLVLSVVLSIVFPKKEAEA